MATISPKTKDGKIISYKLKAYMGRDESGKQIFRCTTWQVPEDLSPSKAERAAQRAAEAWEREAKAEYLKDMEDPSRIKAREISRSKMDFVRFILEDWFPVCIDNGEHKPKNCYAALCICYRLGDCIYAIWPDDSEMTFLASETWKMGVVPHEIIMENMNKTAFEYHEPIIRKYVEKNTD